MIGSVWGSVRQRYGEPQVVHSSDTVDTADTAPMLVVSKKSQGQSQSSRSSWSCYPPSFDEVVFGSSRQRAQETAQQTAQEISDIALTDIFDHPGFATGSGSAVSIQSSRRGRSWGRVLVAVLGWLLVLGLVGGGGYLVYRSFTDSLVEDTMPLPAQIYQGAATDDSTVVLTDDVLTHEWPVVNADSDQGSNTWDINTEQYRIDTMSIKRMAPGSVFIPEAGIYAEVRASDQFESSGYSGFKTLDIPTNVHRGVWYSAGAPLTATDLDVLTGERPTASPSPAQTQTPADAASADPDSTQSAQSSQSSFGSEVAVAPVDQNAQGTTFIASHVSYTRSHRGAFYTMSATVSPGELIWVKGFDGSLSTWRVNGMWFAEHEAFPQEYFSATGPRQLVLTTCGGRVNSRGYYQQNVFTVAVPVPLEDAVNSAG